MWGRGALRIPTAGHPIDAVDAELQTPLLTASHGGPCGSNGKKVPRRKERGQQFAGGSGEMGPRKDDQAQS
jgi:hypothetical protein